MPFKKTCPSSVKHTEQAGLSFWHFDYPKRWECRFPHENLKCRRNLSSRRTFKKQKDKFSNEIPDKEASTSTICWINQSTPSHLQTNWHPETVHPSGASSFGFSVFAASKSLLASFRQRSNRLRGKNRTFLRNCPIVFWKGINIYRVK